MPESRFGSSEHSEDPCRIPQIGDAGCYVSAAVYAAAASVNWNTLTSQVLNGNSASQRPQIGVGDPGELLLDGLQQVLSNVEPLVRVDALLGRKPAGYNTVLQ